MEGFMSRSNEGRSLGAVFVSVLIHGGIAAALIYVPTHLDQILSHENPSPTAAIEFSDPQPTSQSETLSAEAAPTVSEPVPVKAVPQPQPVAKVVAPTPVTNAKEFKPIQKYRGPSIAAVASHEDQATEAQSPEATAAISAPTPPEDIGSAVGHQANQDGANIPETPTAGAVAAGGTAGKDQNKSAAGEFGRSYLDLKQMPGNRAPAYPDDARRENRQGEVELVYYVTPEGGVRDVRIIRSSGHADLDQSAVSAVEKYQYFPGQEGWTEHPVHFELKGTSQQVPSRLRTSQGPRRNTNG